MEFIVSKYDHNWKRFLDGKSQNSIMVEYAIDYDVKDNIINTITSNIQDRLELKFGKLTKEIMMIESIADHIVPVASGFNFKKFNKPFVVYKLIKTINN